MRDGVSEGQIAQYRENGSAFNGQKNVLPQDYFDSLKVGDALDNEDQNPLLWHASSDA